jgi:hypothetical protein
MKEDLTPPGGGTQGLGLRRPRVGAEAGTPTRLLGLRRPKVGAESPAPSGRLGLWRPRVGNRWGLFFGVLLLMGATVLATPRPAAAADIRARCDGNTPVILERPPGT